MVVEIVVVESCVVLLRVVGLLVCWLDWFVVVVGREPFWRRTEIFNPEMTELNPGNRECRRTKL